MRVFLVTLIALACTWPFRGAPAAAALLSPDSTIVMQGDGRQRFDDRRLWERRHAIEGLEQAALRAPKDVALLDRLAGAYLDADFLHSARTCFQRALSLAPADSLARLGLAHEEVLEWLRAPSKGGLLAATGYLEQATLEHPGFADAWTFLAVIRFERRLPWSARDAAYQALACPASGPNAQLASAYLAYRTGDLRRSDSLFAIAIPRLPMGIAARFADVGPLLNEAEAATYRDLPAAGRADFERRFWGLADPDPTTPVNEAQLEYWSRIAHVYLLMKEPWSPEWEARTGLYLRYDRHVQVAVTPDDEYTQIPHVAFGELPDDPAPEALESLHQGTLSDGHALFALLPPGDHPRPLAAGLYQFAADRKTRLLSRVVTPGTPADSVVADFVVLAGNDTAVTRRTRLLSLSACDPAAQRVGDFSLELPPGTYRVAVSVHDQVGGRGVDRRVLKIAAPPPALAISDLVIVCGRPDSDPTAVRLEPNVEARVLGRAPLYAYFEIYQLRRDPSDQNSFEYEYAVEPLDDYAPPGSRLSFHASQRGRGSMRRQFIRVPVAGLPPGSYRLWVRVRDELAGTTAERSQDFRRGGAGN